MAAIPEMHDWISRFGLTCCSKCGFVKNDTSHLRSCPGRVRVELRAAPPSNKHEGSNMPNLVILTGELTDLDGPNRLVVIGEYRVTGLQKDDFIALSGCLFQQVTITISATENVATSALQTIKATQ